MGNTSSSKTKTPEISADADDSMSAMSARVVMPDQGLKAHDPDQLHTFDGSNESSPESSPRSLEEAWRP